MTLPTAPLADLHAVFAEAVTYKVGGAGAGTAIAAIFSDKAGDSFQGPGHSVREVRFEILMSALAQAPRANDTIIRALDPATVWRVIDRTDRGDVSAWTVTVEAA